MFQNSFCRSASYDRFKHLQQSIIQSIRFLSTEQIPIIKIPKYLQTNLSNAIYHEHRKVARSKKISTTNLRTELDRKHLYKKIISWSGDRKLFHYYGRRYDPNNVPLISKLFLKERYNGHSMTIHNFSENPSILQRNSIEEISFTALGLDNDLIASIKDIIGNNSKPSNIQHAVIPKILQFKNVIFSAETGSGKTIAYLAPLIQIIHQSKQLDRNQNRNPKLPYALIILPFRELTEQIGKIAKILARKKDVGVATMIGGLPKHIPQTGMDLIITTIGMIDSHLNNGIYSLRKLDHLVLDESDTLFDDSFLFETMDLIEKLNLNHSQNLVEDDNAIDVPHKLNGTQLICSSATMPQSLDSSIGNVIDMEEDVDQISTKSLHSLHSNIKHIFYRVNRHEKIRKLLELMFEARSNGHPTIIFTNRIDAVNWLYHFLNEKDFPCVRLTKEMDEEERFHSYNSFENGEFNILVATDLGSRGLDTINVRHVINYDCPHYVADYIHRSGRTGRLGSSFVGKVSTLVSFKPDAFMVMELEKAVRLCQPISQTDGNIKLLIRKKSADKKNKLMKNF